MSQHQPARHDQGTLSFKNRRQSSEHMTPHAGFSVAASWLGIKTLSTSVTRPWCSVRTDEGEAQCFSPHDQIVIHVCLWDPCRLPSLKLCLHLVPWVFYGNLSQMLPHFTEGASCPSRTVVAACIGGPRHHCRWGLGGGGDPGEHLVEKSVCIAATVKL